MPMFKVETTFTFKGHFIVTAEDMEEARSIVENDCGLVLGGNIHTTIDDEEMDWDFHMHPDKKVLKVVKS